MPPVTLKLDNCDSRIPIFFPLLSPLSLSIPLFFQRDKATATSPKAFLPALQSSVQPKCLRGVRDVFRRTSGMEGMVEHALVSTPGLERQSAPRLMLTGEQKLELKPWFEREKNSLFHEPVSKDRLLEECSQ